MAALAAVLSSGVAAADVVERRGDEPSLQGTVVSLDGAGVKMRTASGALHAVPWDRVREVQCDPVLAAELKTWMPVAEDLWRARSRLQRRDTTMAEPLLERLFERYRGQTHETALVVAEGLLRCRLARADHGLAVIPALETARLRRAGITTDSYAGLAQVFDESHALCPQLAPVWVDSPFLHALERDLGIYDAQGDAVVTALAQIYHRAVLQTLGRSGSDLGTLPDHPGVALLEDLVAAGSADSGLRERARDRLQRARRSQPEWAESWSRFCSGMSLLGEEGLGRRQRGILELLHLPARFSSTQPFLAGLALAHAASALEQTGDQDAADTLRAELARSYPDHPAQRSRTAAPS
jgi:hypothetical protein